MAKKRDKPSAKLEPIRVYADTSVYGGVFDPELAEASRAVRKDRVAFSTGGGGPWGFAMEVEKVRRPSWLIE